VKVIFIRTKIASLFMKLKVTVPSLVRGRVRI